MPKCLSTMVLVHFRLKTLILLAWLLTVSLPSIAAEPSIFRNGNELVVRIESLDRLIQQNKQLQAVIYLEGKKGIKKISISPTNFSMVDSSVFDMTGFGECTEASIEVRDANGKIVHSARAKPVPEIRSETHPALAMDNWAAIEQGSASNLPNPRIQLPEVSRLNKVIIKDALRTIKAADITFPVIADSDVPILSSVNGVILSRQSFAPDDPSKCSLYFSYRKGIFDDTTRTLKSYRKFLVEVPLDRSWLKGNGDEIVNLPLNRFAIHTSDELEKYGKRWNAPKGYPMLGESSTGLFQGGQSADTDDLGRIYISNVADGAGLIRFNPQLRRFEQPPVNFSEECRKFLPIDGKWKRSWDTDLAQIVCTRGRIYIVFDRNSRVRTVNGDFETCSGVISIPQDNWENEQAFRNDIRLHAASWPGAKNPLFPDEVVTGSTRRTGPPIPTLHGIAFSSWRLDLDERGNTQRLAMVKNLGDSFAIDGTPIAPTKMTMLNGMPRQKYINLGSAGRPLINFEYGQFSMPRAALGLALPGATMEQLVGNDGRYRKLMPEGPTGNLTIKFDIQGKIISERTKFSSLANSLSGLAQGPTYALIAIPDEPHQAIASCEYGYYASKVDFSKLHKDGKVYRSYLHGPGEGQTKGPPCAFQLGPYNTKWIEDGKSLWLYATGYTGISRMKYSENGTPMANYIMEPIHNKLLPMPLDGQPRSGVKDFLHVEPTLNGWLMNIGRGRVGRGGGPYSSAIELFNPLKLGESYTLARMTRCYGLYTPVSRNVLTASDESHRQETFVASGEIRTEYLENISDPMQRPKDHQPKVFVFECRNGENSTSCKLADLYGFSMPKNDGKGNAANLAFSPCRQYLVILQENGTIHTFNVGQRRFVDGLQLKNMEGKPTQPLEFSRPSTMILSAPNGRLFIATRGSSENSPNVTFSEIIVSVAGKIKILPHLSVVEMSAGRAHDLHDVVKCFLPDLAKKDGSYDLILGANPDNGGQPVVRVIEDFIKP